VRNPGSIYAVILTISLALTIGCSQQKIAFKPDPVVWNVYDKAPNEQPKKRDYDRYAYSIDQLIHRQLDDLIDPVDPPPAMNTNALDEVPNSSWFTNRLGREYLVGRQVADGPGGPDDSPENNKPWEILQIKSSKIAPAVRIRDSEGREFTLKFDSKVFLEAFTASEIIASRLMHAAGYNVQASFIVHFTSRDITVTDSSMHDELDTLLSEVYVTGDGRYRAAAVAEPDGADCGIAPLSGVREDDPNDRIPHEHRRELRALSVFCAWLGHVFFTPENMRDIYGAGDSESHLLHYLVDFDYCFGSYFATDQKSHPGFEYVAIDMQEAAEDLFTFGFGSKPWDNIKSKSYTLAGPYYDSESFDPSTWKPLVPVPCFSQLTPQDAFWAAKIISSFGDEHLSAAIKQGQITSSATTQDMASVLKKRRRAIAEWGFSRVCPIDDFSLEFKRQGLVLKFMNLAVKNSIAKTADIEYSFRVMDRERNVLKEFKSGAMSQFIIPQKGLTLSGSDSYVIVEIRVSDLSKSTISLPVCAHFYGGQDSGFALIGIERGD
jgi:hypothetical protein